MIPLCPVCGHEVRVVGDAIEGTQHYEPVEAPLDVERLARAIAAAEGFPEFTPWASERTNARLIAREYAHLAAEETDDR